MPLAILGVLLLIGIIFGPQLWVRQALAREGRDRPDLPGTGGELARHLLDLAELPDVKVEETASGDHYDPTDRTVRLSPDHFGGRSVAAVAVAAHEVGHALQHARGEKGFARRLALAEHFGLIDKVATAILLTAPIIGIVVRSPVLFFIQLGCGIVLLSLRVLMHAVTLPVEFDASFGKALPILQSGRYLDESDLPAARRVLRAAAFTYVASALMTLLDVTRWLRVLRF